MPLETIESVERAEAFVRTVKMGKSLMHGAFHSLSRPVVYTKKQRKGFVDE